MNLLDYFKTFKVDKTPEAITEVANAILADDKLQNAIGSTDPKRWAKLALKTLGNYNPATADQKTREGLSDSNKKSYDELRKTWTTLQQEYNKAKEGTPAAQRAKERADAQLAKMNAYLEKNAVTNKDAYLNQAYNWITGASEGNQKDFAARFQKVTQQLEQKLGNELSNVANILDIPKDASPQERARLEAAAAKKQAEVEKLVQSAQTFGIKTPALTRLESGFVPTSEVQQSSIRTAKEGEPTILKQDSQGNYDIVGTNSGRTLADNVSTDLTQALAIQTQRQAGGTPSLSGRPDLYAVQPTQQEMQPGYGQAFTPYQEQGQTITPQVATLDQINQLRNGTLESFNQANNIQPQPVFQPPVSQVEQQTTQNQVNTAVNTNVNNTTNQLVTATEQLVGQKEQAAAMQGMQVTADMRSAWLQEALDELKQNRYYQEVIRNTEFDLGTTLNRLVEDTRAREMNLAQQYKENLKGTQANLQNRGMLYGGVRQQAEKNLADQTNFGLQQLGQSMQRGLQDTSMQGERTLGSSYVSQLVPKLGDTNLVGRVLAGSPVFQTGEKTNVFQFQGGNYGDLTRSLEEQARVRAGEKESVYRDTFSQYQ